MAEPPEARVSCPACGTHYKWKQEMAGRKLKCRCGAVIRFPREPGGAATIERPAESLPSAPPPPPPEAITPAEETGENAGGYDLDLLESAEQSSPSPPRPVAAAKVGTCPACGQAVKPDAVICLGCGYNLQSGAKMQTALGIASSTAISPGRAGRTKDSKPKVSGLALTVQIFAYIFNGLLVCLGTFSLITLNWCGILALFCTGLYNIFTLIKGSIEGLSMVFSIICNVLTIIMGLIFGLVAILFISGVLMKNPQFQQAMNANPQHLPAWVLQFIGVVMGGVAAVLLLAGVTTFAAVMMTRKR